MSPETSSQRFAFFDVDGTVIQKDSFRIIIRQLIFKRSVTRSLLAAILFALVSVLWAFRLAGKTQFKSAMLWAATVGLGRKKSLVALRQVVQNHIKPLWFSEMEAELSALRAEGFQICYVSASGECWLRALLNSMDRNNKMIVGSKLMYFMGGITLKGPNCIGEEKIIRLNALLPKNVGWEVAYSDHRADIPLFLACQRRVLVNPSPKNEQAIISALSSQNLKVVRWTVGS